MDASTWIGFGTLVTAVVGVVLVVGQLHEQRRAQRAEFGNLYIQRYWQIDDGLLIEPKGSDKHRQHRHRYLRLFEDEFDVARLGFLDEKQWRAWHSVLSDPAAIERIRGDLEACNPEEDEFLRLRACVGQREREGCGHDIADCRGMISR